QVGECMPAAALGWVLMRDGERGGGQGSATIRTTAGGEFTRDEAAKICRGVVKHYALPERAAAVDLMDALGALQDQGRGGRQVAGAPANEFAVEADWWREIAALHHAPEGALGNGQAGGDGPGREKIFVDLRWNHCAFSTRGPFCISVQIYIISQ